MRGSLILLKCLLMLTISGSGDMGAPPVAFSYAHYLTLLLDAIALPLNTNEDSILKHVV